MNDKGLYKYVYNDEIIYIGMSTNSIQERIGNHAKEEKFWPYLKQSKVYVLPMENEVEIKSCESLLINKYKPKLNVRDTQSEGYSIDIEGILGEWEEYKKTKKEKEKKTKKEKEKKTKKDIETELWERCFERIGSDGMGMLIRNDEHNRNIDGILFDLYRTQKKCQILIVSDEEKYLWTPDRTYPLEDFYLTFFHPDIVGTLIGITRYAISEHKIDTDKEFTVEKYEWEWVHEKLIPYKVLRSSKND